MVFIAENGEKSSMSISDVKADLTRTQIFELMDAIIANDVFETKNGRLISKYSAQTTEKQVVKHTA